jgi:hypothetical protein
LSSSLRLMPIDPIAATTAAAGCIIKLGDLLGLTAPTLSDLSYDFDLFDRLLGVLRLESNIESLELLS